MRHVLAEFSAPWSRSLRVATAASVTILLVVALAGQFTGPRQLLLWRVAMVGVPIAVLLGSLPFMVRGYLLTETDIEVRRLGWSTLLPLAGLAAVTGEPEGLRGSLRLFGNGGLFGISGWFWNRRMGRFRAYATDPGRAVLLRYRDGRKVLVTPHDVQHFIVRVRTLANLANAATLEAGSSIDGRTSR
jgi:hypothetical protein